MRSSKSEKSQRDESTGRVGARHRERDLPEGGGGYQNNCTHFNFSDGDSEREKIFADLKKLELPDTWLKVLNVIGPAAFLEMWYVLDDEVTGNGENRISVPAISKFERLRRNQLILRLSNEGHNRGEIAKSVRQITGKNISEKTILRALDE